MGRRMMHALLAWISSSSERLRHKEGWKRPALACAFGALSAFAFPPYNLTPLLWVCFPALVFLLRGTSHFRQAFITGWSYSFGFFVVGLYWIADAMFVDLQHFWWAIPLSVAGLPFFFSISYGIASGIARRLGLLDLAGVIGFALLWFLADYARGHMFTGFPWILTGHTWSGFLPMLQLVSVTGVYGLTLLTLIGACLPALLSEPKPSHLKIVAGSFLIVLALALTGTWRLYRTDPNYEKSLPNIRLRLVQPNTDQAHKWDITQRSINFQHLLDLTSAPSAQPVTHVIWPETAAPFYLMEDAPHRQMIAHHLPLDGSLLTGVIRRDVDDQKKIHYFNSLIAINAQGQVLADYDKFHLVPFGEYIPFRSLLPLRTITNLGLDFSTGDDVHSLRVAGLPSFSPLICYEAIFPGKVIDRSDRPHFLLNITNDGWYGNTAGPYQHFALVKLRAIEEGLPLVRAANTGISGVVDAYGHVTAMMGVGMTGFLDVDLPPALPSTWFSSYGEWTLWILFSSFVLISSCCRFHHSCGLKRPFFFPLSKP